MAPSTESLSNLTPIAVVLAAVAGSGHCLSMCGGLMLVVGKNTTSVLQYQLGRWISYVTLGLIAGGIGHYVFSPLASQWASLLAASVMGLSFLFLGVRSWRGEGVHFPLPGVLNHGLQKLVRLGSFTTGLGSALLPCGWLHSFVLAAAATGSPLKGALLMSAFWLGSVPALSAAPWSIRKIFAPMARAVPRLSGALLVLIGSLTLGYRVLPQFFPKALPVSHHCDSMSDSMSDAMRASQTKPN